MSGQHAFLMPSAAPRWGICALSASLEAAYPEDIELGPTLEGTAAHWVNEQYLRHGALPALDAIAPNGVAVTREMIEGAELAMRTIVATLGPDWQLSLFIERRVPIPAIHPTHCWGTPDYYAWSRAPDGRVTLFVFDYKFGHLLVEARENNQLIAYTSGILSEAGIDGHNDGQISVAMCVIQPRSHHREGPVRWWRTNAASLRGHVNVLRMQAELATSPNPPAKPDPEACRDCKGRHACEALQRAAYLAADKAQQSLPLDLSPHALGLELRALTRAQRLLDARVSGLQQQAESTIKQGKLVPYWMLESTPGRLGWDKPAAEVLMLGQIYGIDIAKPVEPLTPTQAKAKGLPDELVDAYASRPAGASKLTYDDGSKARLTFGSSDT